MSDMRDRDCLLPLLFDIQSLVEGRIRFDCNDLPSGVVKNGFSVISQLILSSTHRCPTQ